MDTGEYNNATNTPLGHFSDTFLSQAVETVCVEPTACERRTSGEWSRDMSPHFQGAYTHAM